MNVHFFDWQLDCFYLDLHKKTLRTSIKDTATDATTDVAVGAGIGALNLVSFLADMWDRQDTELNADHGMNNLLGAILAVLLLIVFFIVWFIASVPWYVSSLLGIAVVGLILWKIVKVILAKRQKRLKKQIVRYSDGLLRSCVYDILWSSVAQRGLINFSVDDMIIQSISHTESVTTIRVVATMIRKYMDDARRIHVVAEAVPMTLSRASDPERKRETGAIMTGRDCPSCGANFEPDAHHCCSYCGYGLKMENYMWKGTQN